MSTTEDETTTISALSVVPTPEETSLRYARHTRNATAFIAWVIGIYLLIGIITGIAVLVHIHDVAAANAAYNNVTNCSSLGGTNPNC